MFARGARFLGRACYNALMEISAGRTGDMAATSDRLRDAQRRFADLRHLSLCFFGFAFVRAWDDIAFARFAALFPNAPWFGQDLMSLGMLPIFVVLVVGARALTPLFERRALMIAAPLLMVVSVVLFEVANLAGLGANKLWDGAFWPLVAVSAFTAGAGAALSILMWAELQSCFNSLQIVLYVSGAFFLGSVIGWMTFGMDESRLVVALLALPVLSFACLKLGFSKIPSDDLPKRTWGKLRFPWKLVIVLGVYEFVLGVKQGASFESDLFAFGVMLASAILFTVVYFFSHRFDFTRIYRTPIVLMVCGLLVALLAFSSNSMVSDVLVSAGYALMFLMLTVLLCDIAHRYGVSAVLLCGIEELVMFTSAAGHLTAAGMEGGMLPVNVDDPAVSVALVMLVVVASMVLLSEREYSRWGASFFGAGRLAFDGDERGRFVQRCAEIEERCGLSPREKEVFQLLAEGKNAAAIERELYIANGTLKSHTRRIYQKLGIHSRDELRTLVHGEGSIGKGRG